MGRPTDYSEELAAAICSRISEGESLKAICASDDMPSRQSVYLWIGKYPSFSDTYGKAQDERANLYFDELVDIADDSTNDYMDRKNSDGSTVRVIDPEAIRRSALRVDTRKWVVSKLMPRKFGERVQAEITGKDGGPIETTTDTPAKLAQALLGMLHAAGTQESGE